MVLEKQQGRYGTNDYRRKWYCDTCWNARRGPMQQIALSRSCYYNSIQYERRLQLSCVGLSRVLISCEGDRRSVESKRYFTYKNIYFGIYRYPVTTELIFKQILDRRRRWALNTERRFNRSLWCSSVPICDTNIAWDAFERNAGIKLPIKYCLSPKHNRYSTRICRTHSFCCDT